MTPTDADAVNREHPTNVTLPTIGPGSTRTRRWRYVVIVLTATIGTLASIVRFVAVTRSQEHVDQLSFTNLAADHLQTVNAGLKDAADLLYALRAYFESRNQPVTPAEFQAFSQGLRQRVPGLRDTGWAPRVTAAQRDTFERTIRESGVPDFQISERDAQGQVVRAGDRPAYFPILVSDPGPPNRPVIGFDVASEPIRGQALNHAVTTDRPAATPPITLVNPQRPNSGMMGVIAVRLPGAPPGDPPAGVVIGSFETATMIENILSAQAVRTDLDMYVFDPDRTVGHRLIFWHSPRGNPRPDESSLLAMRHWQGTLELVDQRWATVLTPSNPADYNAIDHTAWLVLAGGLSMTASLVTYLWLSHRRTQQLERLTVDLHQTTDQLRRHGAALNHLARHDALTGLANRMAFRDEVAAGLRRARRGQSMAVLYLDLDRFKAVNDALGHPAGDQLLREVADRLRTTVREADTITRLGGDEFAIAQTGPDQPASAENLARRLIETLSRPYQIDSQWVIVGVSIGITLAERDDMDVDELLRRADMALYAAKRDGRGTWRFFVHSLEADAQARHGLEMDLRHALEHDEFALYYQPQVSLADGHIRGMEALLRWHHPDRGLVLPGDFIRCAEETGLIVPIGAWVLRTALAVAANWPHDLRVAVNLSSYQLLRDDLVSTIELALAATGQPGTRLELEIAESALMEQYGNRHPVLQRLQALGVRISMDDFGTGHASLSHLRSFPFDRIKVDRSFVASMVDSSQGGAIVRAILELADTLNITSLAEGVETEAQLNELAALGCNEVQGILLCPAQPANAVTRLLADWPATRWAVAAAPNRPANHRIPLQLMSEADNRA